MSLIQEALRLIQRRSVDPGRSIDMRIAYGSVYDMLMYALEGNAECLAQYDDVDLRCEDCEMFENDKNPVAQIMCGACENCDMFCPIERSES